MPLQNRVTPYGSIVATVERGTLMGNRGILHENGKIFRKSMYQGWKICLLKFDNNHRKVMSEGRYTELFFLDEATALSAGHRPCFDCQRELFYKFRSCWIKTNARLYGLHNPMIVEIDRVLHKERITRKEMKVTYQDNALNVGRGAFIELSGKYYLKWKNRYFEWSPAGYVASITLPPNQQVTILTPKSIVRMFKNGYVPNVHDSVKVIEL